MKFSFYRYDLKLRHPFTIARGSRDYADLDGSVLRANDAFEGVRFERGRLVLPDRPGLGVKAKD